MTTLKITATRADIKQGFQLMISIEQCKKILNKGERKYSAEEVKEIRDYLYQIAEIEIEMLNLK